MTNSSKQILVVGYGEMGHAMEYLLAARHQLHCWDKQSIPGLAGIDPEQLASGADIILFCVPVSPLAGLVERLRPLLSANSICLSIAKGLDDAGRPAVQVFSEVLGTGHGYCVMYGPMIAEEIRAGRPAFAQLGCSSVDIFPQLDALFAESELLLEYSADIGGISWASVLKNVYAMLFGVTDELGLGANVRGYLTVASIGEMAQMVAAMGGRPETVSQLAGLGDLVTTATSAGSHHHKLGRLLVRGELARLHGEGVHTLAMTDKFGLFEQDKYPLFELVRQLIADPHDVRQRLALFFSNFRA